MNIAVIGQPLSGKSTFIDALKQLPAHDKNSATCCDQKISRHFVMNNRVCLWEMRSEEQLDLGTSLDHAKIDKYIILIDYRTETWWVRKQLAKYTVSVIIRTKVWSDLINYTLANNCFITDEEFLSKIKFTLDSNFRTKCSIFIIDSYFPGNFEFSELIDHLFRGIFTDSSVPVFRRTPAIQIKAKFASSFIVQLQARTSATSEIKWCTGEVVTAICKEDEQPSADSDSDPVEEEKTERKHVRLLFSHSYLPYTNSFKYQNKSNTVFLTVTFIQLQLSFSEVYI